ncbi:DivIVA domain-containing protein [Micromonospora sp. NPDC048999]|uniref:DivIVA domain-containing protein n=1 Tax=Micromonospora sp. NPDC048999 TaxID=3155391 RepID=UPI0033F36FD0
MTVYRSHNALRGPLTPDGIAALTLPATRLGRRGYQTDDVDALLHRLAFELHRRTEERDKARAESQRIKNALRAWQSERARRDGPSRQG